MQSACETFLSLYEYNRHPEFIKTMQLAAKNDDVELLKSLRPDEIDLYWVFYYLTHSFLKDKDCPSKIAKYCAQNGISNHAMIYYLVENDKYETLKSIMSEFNEFKLIKKIAKKLNKNLPNT
jgi:hypothetical protein